VLTVVDIVLVIGARRRATAPRDNAPLCTVIGGSVAQKAESAYICDLKPEPFTRAEHDAELIAPVGRARR